MIGVFATGTKHVLRFMDGTGNKREDVTLPKSPSLGVD